MPIFLLPVVIVVIASVAYLVRTKDPGRRSRFLRLAGLILMALFTLFLGAFIVGDTFSDPGGWTAFGYVATWAVPIAVLAALAWFRPSLATIVLAVLLVGLFGMYIWSAVSPDAWGSFEDSHGPIRTIIAFAIGAPLALLGWKRPLAAGVLLVLLVLPPAILTLSGGEAISASILVATSPATVTGIFYLLAVKLGTRKPPETDEGTSAYPQPA